MTKAKKKTADTEVPADLWPAYNLQRRKVSELIPYEGNAKKHPEKQINELMAMIKKRGFTAPLLITDKNGVIAGHGRLIAAKRLGHEEVPVIVAEGWTDEEVRAYVLWDNKISEGGEWDREVLLKELIALDEVDFDLSMTGFDDVDVDGLMEEFGETTAAPPKEFEEYDEQIKTEHECPKCKYRWSGKAG